MGMYNTYGDVQLKVDNDLDLSDFKIGDKVELDDGVYVGYEGVVVIVDGIFVKQFKSIIDKWGNEFKARDLVEGRNPLLKVIEKAKRTIKDKTVKK